jgi:hypothetical protein
VNVRELIEVLATIAPDTEVRIGDYLEAGPYTHTTVGGIWRVEDGIVVCANPDDEWTAESAKETLEIIWAPST